MPAWYTLRAPHEASDSRLATCSRLLTLLDTAYQTLTNQPYAISSLRPLGHLGSLA